MSSYSGFSSRKLQDKYNICLKDLISLLSQVIISQINSSKIISFKSVYQKIENQIKKLDMQKYSEPKFSKIIEPLTQFINQLDLVKQSLSEPQKKKYIPLVNNNFVRTRTFSLDQTRKTISFFVSSNVPQKKQVYFKENRYIEQPNHLERQRGKLTQKAPEYGRNKRIYRSRQVSTNLITMPGFKNNFVQNQNLCQQSDLSMQELMKKNPLIERKMSAHRKRRLIKFDFPQIREQDQESEQAVEEEISEKTTKKEGQSKFYYDENSAEPQIEQKVSHQFYEFDGSDEVQKCFIRT